MILIFLFLLPNLFNNQIGLLYIGQCAKGCYKKSIKEVYKR